MKQLHELMDLTRRLGGTHNNEEILDLFNRRVLAEAKPKDNEVDEKVMPVAWIVTNGGESCEPWLEYEQSEVDALPAVCIAEPLYSAATVAELRAKADAAERRVAAALELAQKWEDKAADSWGEDKDDAARQQCCDELRATLTGADPT